MTHITCLVVADGEIVDIICRRAVIFRIERGEVDIVDNGEYHGKCHGEGHTADIERCKARICTDSTRSCFNDDFNCMGVGLIVDVIWSCRGERFISL